MIDARPGPTPLVGRARELALVDVALDALADGAGGCVAIEGEPGIGKTRLLAELRERAGARGQLALGGVAAELERDVPFSVWVDALDAYAVSQELPGQAGWTPALAADLADLLPSLAPFAAAGEADAREPAIADERYRVHRAARTLLGLLAAERPLVLVLDDLHWADDASLELLAALLRRPSGAAVLLALGLRPGQAPPRLAAALAAQDVARLTLAPLGEEEAAELLGALDPPARSAIRRRAGGNPFYLEQLARAAPAAAASDDGAGVAGVPAAVAAALAHELAELPAPARALLDAAAVAGDPFEPDLAAAVAGMDAGGGLEALDALLAADLVRPTRVPRRFAFRHPLVREAVYEAAPGGWRLAAHARAAEALAARGAGAAARAPHVEHAAGPGDEAAIALLLEAGERAAARAPATAARWRTAALRLLPDDDRERQMAVRVALASALRATGELERSRATLLEAIELLPDGADERRVELVARVAAVEHWLGRHEDAHRRLVRARDALPDRASAAAVAVQVELTLDGLYTSDHEQGIAVGADALAAAQALGDPLLTGTAAAALSLAEVAAGRVDDARAHHAQAAALLDPLEDARLAPHLEALYCLAWTENELERYDDAIARADRAVAIARAHGAGHLLVPLLLVKGHPYEMQGRLAEAREACETAVEIARVSANPHDLFWALFELAWARYYASDLDGAIAACEESAQAGGRLTGGTMPSAGGGPGWALAVCKLERGDPAGALALMRELGGEELRHAIPVERCFDWETLALAELACGDAEAAAACAARAEAQAAALGGGLRLPGALAARTRAAVLLAAGDAAGAAAAARVSAEGMDAIGADLQAAYARLLLGRALAAAGARDEAVAVLRDAERTLDACGSLRPRDEARRALRRLGARSEVRGPATPADGGVAALTRRELEVAELIVERMTNRQIAAALFLSDKTVESHVRNLFVKLGVSSRVDVARAVERERRGGGVGS